MFFLSIRKTITKTDLDALASVHQSVIARTGFVPGYIARLDSDGGSVDAALGIGRILRKADSLVKVEQGARCLSSCVYILAGGTSRGVWGSVGIHRPYEPNDQTLLPTEQKAKYQVIGKRIRQYLDEMNIPVRLYEDSLFVSPENIKMLSEGELLAYGLSANDPFSDEAHAAQAAKRSGISRLELAKRAKRVQVECPIPTGEEKSEMLAYLTCSDAVLNGTR